MTNDKFVVIVENDESEWKDQTGILYHHPKRYSKLLQKGVLAIYYKGKLRNRKFEKTRLSNEPHYFGIAKIGNSYQDKDSDKDDLFVTIEEYQPFKAPVLAKEQSNYLEVIPPSRTSNYWRDGVRAVSAEVFGEIKKRAVMDDSYNPELKPEIFNDKEVLLESVKEGSPRKRFTTTYERSKALRDQAIAIHGTTCIACGFNFKNVYGEHGEGYIQVHHVNPVSEFDNPRKVDPATELVPLCANCHAIVHRRKDMTLSINLLKEIIGQKKVNSQPECF